MSQTDAQSESVGEADQKNQLKTATLAVTLLSAAAFVVTADVRVISPMLRVIADEFKSDIGTTGLIVTAYALPYGLFQLVYGPLADRFGKLKVINIALFFFAIGTTICGLAPNLLILNLLRFLTGVAAAAIIPSTLAYIGDNFDYSVRQAIIGRFVGAIAFALILSTGIGGIVADFLNWRYIFIIFGVGSLLICFLLWRLAPNSPDKHNPNVSLGIKALKPYWQLLRTANVQLVVGAVFLEGLCFFGSFNYFGAFLRDHYHLDYLVVGLILSGYGVGSLLYSRNVKKLVAFFGESGLMTWGGVLMGLSMILLAALPFWYVTIPVIMLMGLGYYMLHSTLQTKATELSTTNRSTAVSLFAFMLFTGQGIGAAALGVIIDNLNSYELIFAISSVGLVFLGWGFVQIQNRLIPLQ